MTYRVSRSASTYEVNDNSEPYLAHYVHSGPQSSSVANIQQLATLHRQQQYLQDQTELHRFAQNADRFTTNDVSKIWIFLE